MTTLALVPSTPSTELYLPPLIVGAGERAAWRFLEFFTVNIRNKNTRAAYARAAGAFLHWCEGQGISELGRVQPVHVAAYIELMQAARSAPAVKQHPGQRGRRPRTGRRGMRVLAASRPFRHR